MNIVNVLLVLFLTPAWDCAKMRKLDQRRY